MHNMNTPARMVEIRMSLMIQYFFILRNAM
jgi:hypothetical protein